MVTITGDSLAADLTCVFLIAFTTVFILAAVVFYRGIRRMEARLSALEGNPNHKAP